jgi:hypothetical protein
VRPDDAAGREDGLRLVLQEERKRASYELPDRSVGDPNRPDPLEALSWSELRDELYAGRS